MNTIASTASTENRRTRVLIVDDVPANLGVLVTCLHDAGYKVLVATGGDKALVQLDDTRPDLILLDVNMPGMDGYEICRRLKANARWAEVPVLFLTAQGDPLDRMQGFAVGAVDYITKPLHPGEVLARVHAHLQIRALQQALKEKNSLLEAAMAWRLEAEKQLQQSLDRAVLIVGAEGGVGFCTRMAQRLLTRHFPGHLDTDTLPEPLARWLEDDPSGGPWLSRPSDSRLEVQRFASGQPGAPLMLLLVEHVLVTSSPARLLSMGLTAREAEVLFWAAQGKSNSEVATILDMNLATAKKHVVNILLKTGLESRLVAALRAAELLELGGGSGKD